MNVDIFDTEEPVSIWFNEKMHLAFAHPEYGPMKYDPEKDDWSSMDREEWMQAMEDARPVWSAAHLEELLGKS